MNYVYGLWLPPDASAQGARIDLLINLLHVFMVLLFVGWGIFMIYCLVRFRARAGHTAQYAPIHASLSKYLEVGVVLFEVFLLVVLSIPAWARLRVNLPDEKDAVVIRVVAQQFAWNIHYAGADGIFGRTDAKLMDESQNPLGIDPDDPHGKDDIKEINNLYIPEGKNVIVKLTSKDVIHCFWIPVLRVKQDAIPGMEVPIWFQAKLGTTTPKDQPVDLACAQLCGLSHSTMRGMVHIMNEADFKARMASAGKEETFEEPQ